MRAAVLERFGGPEVLQIHDLPDLTPGLAQIRVRVAATALNRADLAQREGRYPQPAPKPGEVLGLEFSGTVDLVGPGVTAWRLGDRVFGLVGDGGYAEQLVTHERMLMRIPQEMSFEEAAAVPEVYFTAYDAVVDRAHVDLGDVVLIHAAGSGVGTAAIQLAKAMGARVIATTGTDDKAIRAQALGADRVVVYKRETFESVVMEETGGRGADVILDFIGGSYLERNVSAAAMMGRIVLIGALGAPRGEVDVRPFFSKRLTMIGTTLRSRPIEQKIDLTQRFVKQLLPLFGEGRLKPIIDSVFSLNDIADAHRHMEENRNFGKIIVRTLDYRDDA